MARAINAGGGDNTMALVMALLQLEEQRGNREEDRENRERQITLDERQFELQMDQRERQFKQQEEKLIDQRIASVSDEKERARLQRERLRKQGINVGRTKNEIKEARVTKARESSKSAFDTAKGRAFLKSKKGKRFIETTNRFPLFKDNPDFAAQSLEQKLALIKKVGEGLDKDNPFGGAARAITAIENQFLDEPTGNFIKELDPSGNLLTPIETGKEFVETARGGLVEQLNPFPQSKIQQGGQAIKQFLNPENLQSILNGGGGNVRAGITPSGLQELKDLGIFIPNGGGI